MNLEAYSSEPVPWAVSQSAGDALFTRVICTAFSYSRNFDGYPFPASATDKQQQEIDAKVRAMFPGSGWLFSIPWLPGNEQSLLLERFLYLPGVLPAEESVGEAKDLGSSRLAMVESGEACVLTNQNEHLRYSRLFGGFPAKETASGYLDDMAGRLSAAAWAVSPELGYLQADPSLAGSGFTCAALVHFPVFNFSGQQDKMMNALWAMGLSGKGQKDLIGAGGLVWVCSRGSLGRSASRIYLDFQELLKAVLSVEWKMEQTFYEKDNPFVEDRAFRALALLKEARRMPYREFLSLYSWMRLGCYLQLLDARPSAVLSQALVKSAPAHLGFWNSSSGESGEEEVKRADFLRKTLKDV